MNYINSLSSNKEQHLIKIQRGLFCYLQKGNICQAFYFDSYHLPESEFMAILEHWLQENKTGQAKLIGHSQHIKAAEQLLLKKSITVEKKVERESFFEVLYFPSQQKLQVTKTDQNVLNLQKKYNDEIVTIPTAHKNEKIKVLIVDDSSTIRTLLIKIFSSDPKIEVVAMAENPLLVEDLIKKYHPDVITLDIHMPHMDGLTLLKKYLPQFPIPNNYDQLHQYRGRPHGSVSP